jgi:hypothetical protein
LELGKKLEFGRPTQGLGVHYGASLLYLLKRSSREPVGGFKNLHNWDDKPSIFTIQKADRFAWGEANMPKNQVRLPANADREMFATNFETERYLKMKSKGSWGDE